MKGHRNLKNTPLLLAGLVLAAMGMAFLSLSVGIVGAHGGDSELIHACVGRSGFVKIVGADDTCRRGQLALDWNAEGMLGSPGADGADGTDGTDGTDGADGADGATNVTVVHGVATGSAVRVFCPAGTKVVGGGGYVQGTTLALMQNHPIDATGANATTATLAGWQVASQNFAGTVQGFVLCASP